LYYGYRIDDLTIIPTSKGAMPNNQFNIRLITDDNSQRSPITGLSISRDQGILLEASASSFSMKVTWLQPVTNKEVEIFSYGPQEILQEQPLINTGQALKNYSEKGTKRIYVTAQNIIIPKTTDGSNKRANIQTSVKADLINGLEGKAVIISGPDIRESNGTYEIEALIQVNPSQNEKKIQGTVKFTVTATAINSVNSKRSEPLDNVIEVPVKYEVKEQGGGWGPSPW